MSHFRIALSAALALTLGAACVEHGKAHTIESRKVEVFDPCANFPCPPGQHCTAPADAPMCVADEAEDAGTPTSACAAVLCPPATHCIVTDGEPSCVPYTRDPCAHFECPEGQHCTAPADAPSCVPDEE